MDALDAALLVNILGYIVGISLYAMLVVMVVRNRGGSGRFERLLFATGVLGLIWNAGELLLVVQKDLGSTSGSPLVMAAAYSALGFLPSVVVHSALGPSEKRPWLTIAAYSISSVAAVFHFYSAMAAGVAPSRSALQILTIGALLLAIALLVSNYRNQLNGKTVCGAALLVFALSAFHLGSPGDENFWPIELVAHQSSLPLALVILYQNYRFAFGDLFLKRAVSLILLALVAFGLYVFAASPLANYHIEHNPTDIHATGVMLAFWIATALIYPSLHRFAIMLVDKVLLHRPDYLKLQQKIVSDINAVETDEEVLDKLTDELGSSLTARERFWEIETGEVKPSVSVDVERDRARLSIPTHDAPRFSIVLGNFEGGRRLLSEESEMLEAVGLIAARRLDSLRVIHERCDRELREQEFSKLAAEAQLTALRAQINPHFLFNALTTIGYLIQTSPDKAFTTLLHLTKLLRSVLSDNSEFSTLGDELHLIKNYLDIERARFEERLSVVIDVPAEYESLKIPSLILQPLVENAIKHGISERRSGGELKIAANRSGDFLNLSVSDSGSGRSSVDIKESGGVGIQNVRNRLSSYYGSRARFALTIDAINGSRSDISLPIETAKN
jgi:two-component system LytT family sensor kinase